MKWRCYYILITPKNANPPVKAGKKNLLVKNVPNTFFLKTTQSMHRYDKLRSADTRPYPPELTRNGKADGCGFACFRKIIVKEWYV